MIEHARPRDWPRTGHGAHVEALGGPARAPDRGTPWAIPDGEVHVWWSRPGHAHAVDDLSSLDDAERARAERFRLPSDRARYIAHHAFTRRVLAPYLGVAPEGAAIGAAVSGKPEVDAEYGIEFNTSRSGGLSVVAVANSGTGVGVDIEHVRPIEDALRLADGLFTDRERRHLRSVPSSRRDEAFLSLWTRKEAVAKAFGLGLSVPLDSFDVVPGTGPRDVDEGRLGARPFVVRTLDAPAGWVAAVSVTVAQLTIRRMDSAGLSS